MGFRNRFKNKRDENEGQIVAQLEAHGFTVERLDQPVDLAAGYGGTTYLLEVKNGKGRLTQAQVDFFERWRGHADVIRSLNDVDAFAAKVKGD